ncbi:MAG: helix-turn-helix domain-containing protein [Candidatus Levybacteria bacterium]|nr:helix-turn-helix domain-containing protein [Candidatus Levybacteria bacterium]
MENLFNINQAAFILKVHHLTVRRYIKEGRLKAIKAGGNVRIKESELQNFNKDFAPYTRINTQLPPRRRSVTSKIFTSSDPLFRLRGRGAKLHVNI